MASRQSCPNRTPEQRRRDDALVLASSLVTVAMSLLVVLLG